MTHLSDLKPTYHGIKVVLLHLVPLPIVLGIVMGVVALWGQTSPSVTQQPAQIIVPINTPSIDLSPTGMTKDVWFWIFVGWYVFSAMTTGMPEPDRDSSPWYIWAYRSLHILLASGTAFFQNKLYWPSKEDAK